MRKRAHPQATAQQVLQPVHTHCPSCGRRIFSREAAQPVYEADRHAKKELKKQVRGIRPLERAVEGREDEAARIVPG